MTKQAYGSRTRRPVIYRGEQVEGLFSRRTIDGGVVYEVRRKVGGQSIRRALKATTASDAIREARALVAKLDGGARLVGRTDVSLKALRESFDEWSSGPTCNLATGTRAMYLSRLDRHVLPALGGTTRATAVTPAHVRGMIDRLSRKGLSGGTVGLCVAAAAALFRYGVRSGVLQTNPVRGLERGDRPSSKRQTEPRYLGYPEIVRLLGKCGEDLRPLAATLAFAGLRVSEATALTWDDLDLKQGILHVPGTKTAASKATVPVIEPLAVELRRHRKRQAAISIDRIRKDAPLFPTSTGHRHIRQNVHRSIVAAGDRAKLNPPDLPRVTPHDLRHSCAALLFAAGATPPTVAAVLRHSNPAVTLTFYAGVVESGREALRADLEAAFR